MTISRPLAASLREQSPKAPKSSKFGNKKTVVDGITFHSKKEAARYSTLKLLERAGEIVDLKLQPRFPLKIGERLICTYVGDFSYRTNPVGKPSVGEFVIEDVKGFKTPEYKLKAKLFEALFGFPIREV